MSFSPQLTAQPLRAERSGPLKGRARPPGDKSISHRALIFGLLAAARPRSRGCWKARTCCAPARPARRSAPAIERRGEGRWTVAGAGLGSLSRPAHDLDFGNAGTGSRLMMGVVGGHGIVADLRRRRVAAQAADAPHSRSAAADGRAGPRRGRGRPLPDHASGASDPAPIVYRTPVASAQIKSAVLLAGLNARGRTTVIEAEASRDHTEKMLAHFGAEVSVEAEGEGRRITLVGRPELRPARSSCRPTRPRRPSPSSPRLIAPGSDIVVEGVMMNPLRAGLFTTLIEMGARIDVLDRREEGGEEVADLRVRSSDLKGVDVPARARRR